MNFVKAQNLTLNIRKNQNKRLVSSLIACKINHRNFSFYLLQHSTTPTKREIKVSNRTNKHRIDFTFGMFDVLASEAVLNYISLVLLALGSPYTELLAIALAKQTKWAHFSDVC